MKQNSLDKNDRDEKALEQVRLMIAVKKELDTELGASSYPDSFAVACHNWCNKWAMSAKIAEDRRTQYNHPVTVKGSTNTNTPKSEDNASPCTEKQRKALFVITHDKVDGRWKENDKAQHLTKTVDDYSFEEAREFIDTHGRK